MGISMITAINIATNYPDNIMIASGIDEGLKWAGYIYLMRDGQIHNLQISTSNVYDDEETAKQEMQKLCESFKEQYA